MAELPVGRETAEKKLKQQEDIVRVTLLRQQRCIGQTAYLG